MNTKLTEQIVFHVLANLGVLPANFVNAETTRSLVDKSLLLSEKLAFEVDGETIRKNVYGCQLTIADNKEFKMLLADCTQDKEFPEFGLLVQLKDSPSFGVYFMQTEAASDPTDSE